MFNLTQSLPSIKIKYRYANMLGFKREIFRHYIFHRVALFGLSGFILRHSTASMVDSMVFEYAVLSGAVKMALRAVRVTASEDVDIPDPKGKVLWAALSPSRNHQFHSRKNASKKEAVQATCPPLHRCTLRIKN
jgi:hypothetical protein